MALSRPAGPRAAQGYTETRHGEGGGPGHTLRAGGPPAAAGPPEPAGQRARRADHGPAELTRIARMDVPAVRRAASSPPLRRHAERGGRLSGGVSPVGAPVLRVSLVYLDVSGS